MSEPDQQFELALPTISRPAVSINAPNLLLFDELMFQIGVLQKEYDNGNRGKYTTSDGTPQERRQKKEAKVTQQAEDKELLTKHEQW